MPSCPEVGRWRERFLWGMLLLYLISRLCQLYTDRLPTLLIVVLHVVPPALFAVAHGSALYQAKGIAVFATFCLGLGTLAETISLRTGVPFGHYYFTEVMGPKIFQLPVFLALAYLGLGYVSWILAVLILGYADRPLRGRHVFAVPFLAGLIMLAWDLSMEPIWATMYRAWIWQSGGAYFGVPASNFFGWFFTAYFYYQAFALYCRANPVPAVPPGGHFWRPAILLYAVCALGNLLILKMPMLPPVVADAVGRQWLTGDILRNCVLISVLVMAPLALFAWVSVPGRPAKAWQASAGS